MIRRLQEVIATIAVLGCLIAVPLAMIRHGPDHLSLDGRRVIVLTGVQKAGVWTAERVTASNLPGGDFEPATIRVAVGEEVVLRLHSADVTHGFYVPELGVGPVEVEAGHVVDVVLRGEQEGVFEYYCTMVCGDCHYFMRGKVIVGDPPDADEPLPWAQHCPGGGLDEIGPMTGTLAEQGARLFSVLGCTSCHARGGVGGVHNPNAIKETVPALNVLGERMLLFESEDAEAVLELLEEGADLAGLERPPFPRFAAFLAQYQSVRALIRNGNRSDPLDPEGPVPPLSMPHWGEILSEHQITALVAHLITLQEFDE